MEKHSSHTAKKAEPQTEPTAQEPKPEKDSLGQENPATAMERDNIKEATERSEKAVKEEQASQPS
jgi:hypothetical protein